MTDEEFTKLLRTIPRIHSEIDAIETQGHDPAAAHVMLTNLYTWLCIAADRELSAKSPELEALLAQRVRITGVLSKNIVDQISDE